MTADPLAPFRAAPARSALLFDVDGVLAPIASRPELAQVPPDRLEALAALRDRYRLVGCVSGRPMSALRALVPVTGLALAANHGMEIDRGEGLQLADGVAAWLPRMEEVARSLVAPAEADGGWVEDKGATLALHWRGAPDPGRAGERLGALAAAVADANGLVVRPARMAVELRPPLPLDKGTAVRTLLAGRGCERSLFCGDDATDIDAFREVDLAIAVVSDEAPEGLVAAADLVVREVSQVMARL
jgi:trehalose-phosphatase